MSPADRAYLVMLKSVVFRHTYSELPNEDPLFTRILPNQEYPSLYVKPAQRSTKDGGFSYLYALFGVILIIVSFFHGNTQIPVSRSIYQAIIDNSGLLGVLSALSIVAAMAWVVFLNFYAHVLFVDIGSYSIHGLLYSIGDWCAVSH